MRKVANLVYNKFTQITIELELLFDNRNQFERNYGNIPNTKLKKIKQYCKYYMQKNLANSRHLFKNFIGINDNQSNISKTVKALKILDQDLNQTKARSTKLFDKVQEEKQNQITKPCKVAEEVASFLSIRDQLSIQ